MFRKLILLLVALLLLPFSVSGDPRQSCRDPVVRREWRSLSVKQRLDYLQAVQCLLAKPPLTSTEVAPGVGARYEDFVITHILQTLSIHFVGHFLPWHRYFTAIYEKALREECGYKGAQPYWDWTLDVTPSSRFVESPMWDPITGFGGNGPFVEIDPSNPFAVPGRTGGGCVQDGPFKNMTVRMGPVGDVSGNPRCLSRDFSPYFAGRYLGRNVTKHTLAQPDYGWFARVVEGAPSFDDSGVHGGGHFGVGGTLGEMGDQFNSPSDPVFYLHHANLDRVWWSWQHMDPHQRLKDISGPINLLDYDNVEGGNVTLNFPLSIGVNAPNVTVSDVMDVQGGTLCYAYDHLY
ncbi:Tyrosinase [Leucoagaricus sp. SymC.cos]|nr:Tyrosinase [Leucoagaricus sp. SymC.cos]